MDADRGLLLGSVLNCLLGMESESKAGWLAGVDDVFWRRDFARVLDAAGSRVV